MKHSFWYAILLFLFLGYSFLQAQNCRLGSDSKSLDYEIASQSFGNRGNIAWTGTPNLQLRDDLPNFNAMSMWIAGKVNDKIRATASFYNTTELFPGPLDINGKPLPNCEQYNRIYKVSREDIWRYDSEGFATQDMLDWPYKIGAPVIDGDGDPNNYDLEKGDRPQVIGDEMLWWVMNDVGIHEITQSEPLGIEIQFLVAIFSFSCTNRREIMMSNKIANYSQHNIEDMYVGFFVDGETSQNSKDFAGYNSDADFGYFYPSEDKENKNANAIGLELLRGPISDKDSDGTLDTLGVNTFQVFPEWECLSSECWSGKEIYQVLQGKQKNGDFFHEGLDSQKPPTTYMYNAPPGEYWSEENIDGNGTKNLAGRRRFVMATGPFKMGSGDVQQLIWGVLGKSSKFRSEAVEELLWEAYLVRGYFYYDYWCANTLSAPHLSVQSSDKKVYLTWGNMPYDRNYLDSFHEVDPLLPNFPGFSLFYDFEGYQVLAFESESDIRGKVIATYDVKNGVKKLYDYGRRWPEMALVAEGTDSGVQHHHEVAVTPYKTHHFGVRAYAYNVDSIPKVLFSPISRISVIPTNGIARNPCQNSVIEYGATIAPEVLSGNPNEAKYFTAKVADPTQLKEFFYYEVRFYEGFYRVSKLTSNGWSNYVRNTISFDIWNKQTNKKIFDGQQALSLTERPFPAQEILVLNGVAFSLEETDKISKGLVLSFKGNYGASETCNPSGVLGKIGITPNPYKGASAYETSNLRNEVRFTNLPQKVSITVYTLSGTKVRTFHKNDEKEYLLWDLTNEAGIRLASGMYLVHFEAPGIGETIVKFGLINKALSLHDL